MFSTGKILDFSNANTAVDQYHRFKVTLDFQWQSTLFMFDHSKITAYISSYFDNIFSFYAILIYFLVLPTFILCDSNYYYNRIDIE